MEVNVQIIDIHSKSEGAAGILSNLTDGQFIFDGVECLGREGLLQSFKIKDLKRQQKICLLGGIEAKQWGNKHNLQQLNWMSTQLLWWEGVSYRRNSWKYQRLLDRVFNTYYDQSKIFRDTLALTVDAILIHSIGSNDSYKTILTEEEFCSRLMRLRKKGCLS